MLGYPTLNITSTPCSQDHLSDKNPVVFKANDGIEYTVLHGASRLGNLEIIRYYKDDLNFSNINPMDNKGNTPLRWAIKDDRRDVMKYFLDCGYNATGT